MHWERLAAVRTVVLILVGMGAFVTAVWGGLGMWWSLGALALACLILEFMTGGAPRGPQPGR